jgi:hypothetical protein
VDGYVEANSSAEAIDRLADQGIIGVHTVRPEAKKPRNTVILGTADVYEDEPPKALPAAPPAPQPPVQQFAPQPAPQPIYIPVPTPGPAVGGEKTEQILGQLVDKLTTLMGQVEQLLSRPSQIIYQSGPARNGGGGGGGGSSRKPRQGNEAQDKTLMAIFQTNMDLRRSLNKLSTVVANGVTTPAANGIAAGSAGNGSPASASNAPVGNSGNGSPAATAPTPSVSPRMEPSRIESGRIEPGRIEPGPKPSAGNGRERVLKPQPAA